MVIQIDGQHDYLLGMEDYPISENNRPATYDQFMTLRDTLIRSKKYYADKAGRSLIIWTKLDWTPTDTIEIREPNMFIQNFDGSASVIPDIKWEYITVWGHISINPLSCEIVKDGRYRIQHKEQFNNIDSWITRIHSLVVQHTPASDISRAVFDWERATWGEMIRMTAFGYVECDLNKWDWLELKILDQNDDPIPLSELQNGSNWWQVEYIDLIYN